MTRQAGRVCVWCVALRSGMDRKGMDWQARYVKFWLGGVRRGMVRQACQRRLGQGSLWSVAVR